LEADTCTAPNAVRCKCSGWMQVGLLRAAGEVGSVSRRLFCGGETHGDESPVLLVRSPLEADW
jgi:hypothetical protein